VRVTAEAASAIAQRSRGTPRTAIQIFERAMARRSALKHRGGDDIDEITQELVEDTADLLQIDEQGLTKPQRDYLQALARSPGGVLGVENLASVLSIDKATIQREIEPHLLRQGFVTVCRGGRQITPEGLDHAGPEHVSPIMKRLA
jgi:Holliday junction resolvasome RuvABC ATP-dependent DNA helicase subunit